MEEENVTQNTMSGGKKKKNGHKMSCKCPICMNMMKKDTLIYSLDHLIL